jgi:5-methylcytosine-specific restriction endonuclease McrA
MNLAQLKDNELNNKVKSLVAEERKLTQIILEHIAEIDRRQLFLKMAYSSLFDYLTKEINYSAGAAQRRIDAARMLQKIPDVAQKIETGRLNLSQISRVQQICRQIKRESGETVPTHMQKTVLNKIENLNSVQTDLLLAQEFQLEIKTHVKTQTQRDESTRIELTFSKEEMAIIKSAQALLSHKTGGGLKETLIQLAQEVLKKTTPQFTPKTTPQFTSKSIPQSTATVAVESRSSPLQNKPVKSITPALRKKILFRDQFCQFINANTGKVCGSRHFLEVDHIIPKFVGGDHGAENLRVLCKSHNIYRFENNI